VKLLSPIIDRIQAAFPPNRVCILLAAPIVAASAWISGFVSANIPGVTLPTGVIAGIIGAACLVAVTLIYKWFDQWQKGEPIHVDTDLLRAYEEMLDGNSQTINQLLGAHGGVRELLEILRGRVADSKINPAEIVEELEHISAAINEVLDSHEATRDAHFSPPTEVAFPAPAPDAAPPTAAE
jgi:hypothetical protein